MSPISTEDLQSRAYKLAGGRASPHNLFSPHRYIPSPELSIDRESVRAPENFNFSLDLPSTGGGTWQVYGDQETGPMLARVEMGEQAEINNQPKADDKKTIVDWITDSINQVFKPWGFQLAVVTEPSS